MNNKLTLLFLFLFFHVFSGFSQSGILPLKSGNSVLFGQDVVIKDSSILNQRQVVICSAYNGWLYAAYSYIIQSTNMAALTLLKSVDNGNTWDVLWDSPYPLDNSEFKRVDILAAGDSISNIKIFLAGVVSNSFTGLGNTFVIRYNGVTGEFENELLKTMSAYISISSDFIYPASNSNPYSIGILCSKYSNSGDSIIFYSSSNGGSSIDNRQVVAVSGNRFHKVALTNGRSPSCNSGRYFAVWEEQADFTSESGHIYSSHSEPNYNSPFTTPVMLDSIDPSALDKARNPSVACQYNNLDNDSSNLTEVVLFEKYIPAENKVDIDGFYNMKSTSTNHFQQFKLTFSSDNIQQPSVCFNPFDSKFIVTYHDSTTQKLPFLLNTFNMTTPDNWQVVSPGYNDSPNLDAPAPKVAMNFGLHQAVMAWSKKGTGGNGVALFDAPNNYWAGIPENDQTDDNAISVFPNPSSSNATIKFDLNKSGLVNIALFNTDGRYIKTIANQPYQKGKTQVKFDASVLTPGTYFYNFQSVDFSTHGKIIVIR